MDQGILQQQIKKRFEQISEKSWFCEDIEDDNFQLLELYDFFGNVEDKKILDIGCAKGRFVKKFIEEGAIITGVDLSESLISKAKKNIPSAQFIVGSGIGLPFKNEEFDCVYSIETFEHIPNTERGISEACRVLKKGGKIIIIDKNYFGLHPNFLIPNPIRKFILEKSNKWMYKNNFAFREKHFIKQNLDRYLNLYCKKCYTKFLRGFRPGPKMLRLRKKYPRLAQLKVQITNLVYKIFPFTSYCISWRWEK